MTFKILIVDQFSPTPSPYQLSVEPMKFDALVELVMATPVPRYVSQKPEVREVEESFTPRFCTTTFRADEEGNAEVWKYRWDSSG